MLLTRPVTGTIGAQRSITASSMSERHTGLDLRAQALRFPGGPLSP